MRRKSDGFFHPETKYKPGCGADIDVNLLKMSQGPPMDVWSEGLPCIGDTYGVKKWLECKW